MHKNHDAWHVFISKWSNLFNQSYNKETDGALFDQDIRDIFLDDIPCKYISTKNKRIFSFYFLFLKIIMKQQQQQQLLMNNIKLNNYYRLFLLGLSVHDMDKKLNK